MPLAGVFLDTVRTEISQGDVFEDIEFVRGTRGDGVLLIHDCEYDKPSVEDVLVARTFSRDVVPRGSWGPIAAGNAYNAIHLPPVAGHPESYINLRHIYRVPKANLIEADASGRRVASMTDSGRDALITYLFRFFTRRLPRDASDSGGSGHEGEGAVQ